jgi:hypothetical protein
VLAEPLTLNWKGKPVMPLAADLQISRVPQVVVVLVLAVAAEATSGKVPTTRVRAARAPNRRLMRLAFCNLESFKVHLFRFCGLLEALYQN